MLDIIRKRAADWGVKVIFGIIIIVFVFFFGYNRISQRYSGGGKGAKIVAKVNGTVISRPEYNLAYENTKRMFVQMFKQPEGEPLPEGLEKNVRLTALNQLIQQTVIKSLGDKLGLEPSRTELVEAIRNSPVAKDETGKFDPYLYKQRFLPYFAQKYNVDYEDLVANDITGEKVRDVFGSFAKVADAHELYNLDRTKWTFEVAEYDSEDAAKTKSGGKSKKVGPIKISENGQIFPSEPDVSVLENIFKIASANTGPYNVGGKWYTVKLISVDRPIDSQWEKDKDEFIKSSNITAEQEYFRSWMSELTKNLKIKKYIED